MILPVSYKIWNTIVHLKLNFRMKTSITVYSSTHRFSKHLNFEMQGSHCKGIFFYYPGVGQCYTICFELQEPFLPLLLINLISISCLQKRMLLTLISPLPDDYHYWSLGNICYLLKELYICILQTLESSISYITELKPIVIILMDIYFQ